MDSPRQTFASVAKEQQTNEEVPSGRSWLALFSEGQRASLKRRGTREALQVHVLSLPAFEFRRGEQNCGMLC